MQLLSPFSSIPCLMRTKSSRDVSAKTAAYWHPFQFLTLMPEALCRRSNIHEVLWNFGRFDSKDKGRLTLKQNPHFYKRSDLPIFRGAYVDQFNADPIDYFHDSRICVLTDKPGRLFLNTGRNTRAFGNIWTPREAIIFKGPQI